MSPLHRMPYAERHSESKLLLACARSQLDDHSRERIEAYLSPEVDWTALVSMANAHGVTGLLCKNLVSLDNAAIPSEIIRAAEIHLVQQRQFNQLQADSLCTLLDALEQQGIPAIPFKGPVLAALLYEDIALRQFRDLDFLVREQDISGTLSVLNRLGYERNFDLSAAQEAAYHRYGGQEVCFGEGLPVEPHWAFAPRTLAVDLDYGDWWSRSCSIPFNGRSVACLATEDLLILLCLHGTKEQWRKLKWIADVADFILAHPQLDWSTVHERASQTGTLRMVHLGISLTHSMLDSALPDASPDWLGGNKTTRHLSSEVENRFYTNNSSQKSLYQLSAFYWQARERQSDRLRYLLRTITTPRVKHFAVINLPDAIFFAYYPFKILYDYFLLPLWVAWKSLRNEVAKT